LSVITSGIGHHLRFNQWNNKPMQEQSSGENKSDLDDLIAKLDGKHTHKLPKKALRTAQELHKEITPRLIELIRQATQTVRAGNRPQGNGHLFALYLLTEFQAKEALPAIREAVTLPGEGPFELFGDAITEDLSRVLAALAVDSPPLIDELIADRSLNEYVRWKAAQTYLFWVRDGLMTRDQAVQRLREHLYDANSNRDTRCGQWIGRRTRLLFPGRGDG
jgi:hypothetical protein